MKRAYEKEYNYYLKCYVDRSIYITNGNPTKEESAAAAIAVYDKDHGKARTHQTFEEEINRMIG